MYQKSFFFEKSDENALRMRTLCVCCQYGNTSGNVVTQKTIH